jgi:hypothetical protein
MDGHRGSRASIISSNRQSRLALLDHYEAIPASFRPVGAAGLAGATHKIRFHVVCCKIRARNRINRFSMPNMARPSTRHPSSSGRESPESPAGCPWQGLRPGGLCAVALVASGSPSCSSRRQDSGIRRGGGGDAKASLALWFLSCSWWFAQVLWVGDRG